MAKNVMHTVKLFTVGDSHWDSPQLEWKTDLSKKKKEKKAIHVDTLYWLYCKSLPRPIWQSEVILQTVTANQSRVHKAWYLHTL